MFNIILYDVVRSVVLFVRLQGEISLTEASNGYGIYGRTCSSQCLDDGQFLVLFTILSYVCEKRSEFGFHLCKQKRKTKKNIPVNTIVYFMKWSRTKTFFFYFLHTSAYFLARYNISYSGIFFSYVVEKSCHNTATTRVDAREMRIS